jgi:hypothetical protein
MNDLLSIHDTAERCKAEGLPLSEKAIRRFVKTGDLAAIQTGKKALVFFPNIIELVKCGNNQLDRSKPVDNVRKIMS